jgi:hypothetical protein
MKALENYNIQLFQHNNITVNEPIQKKKGINFLIEV